MAGNEDPFRGTLDNAQRAGLPRPDEEASDEEMEALEPPQANIVPRANTRRGPGDYTRQMVLINIFQLEGNTAPRTNDNQIVRVVINQALTSGQLLARIKEGFLDPNRVNVRAAERRKIERASLRDKDRPSAIPGIQVVPMVEGSICGAGIWHPGWGQHLLVLYPRLLYPVSDFSN
ncbi:hypothetical protein Bbelb_311750 [Branchiostoma belcheri]|nr:hypothetical protein Bbelb_311750 [Branchiostoma belcheri]